MQPDFLETVERTVRETEIESDMFGIEITETAFSSLNHLRILPNKKQSK
jgi:EAL domain-containing protein (putative c-di-GMP-specific phosphodiesterase class I)